MNQGLLFDIDIKTKESSSFYEAMNFFKSTPKTEESFYLRFQVMPVEYKNTIKSYYQLAEEWQVFKKICKFWNV